MVFWGNFPEFLSKMYERIVFPSREAFSDLQTFAAKITHFVILAFWGGVSCGICPLGTAPGLTSPFYGAPGPNPGGSERLLADWLRPFLVG
jgi:hypothetical protein